MSSGNYIERPYVRASLRPSVGVSLAGKSQGCEIPSFPRSIFPANNRDRLPGRARLSPARRLRVRTLPRRVGTNAPSLLASAPTPAHAAFLSACRDALPRRLPTHPPCPNPCLRTPQRHPPRPDAFSGRPQTHPACLPTRFGSGQAIPGAWSPVSDAPRPIPARQPHFFVPKNLIRADRTPFWAKNPIPARRSPFLPPREPLRTDRTPFFPINHPPRHDERLFWLQKNPSAHTEPTKTQPLTPNHRPRP